MSDTKSFWWCLGLIGASAIAIRLMIAGCSVTPAHAQLPSAVHGPTCGATASREICSFEKNTTPATFADKEEEL